MNDFPTPIPEALLAPAETPAAPPPPTLRRFFFGDDGLRAGWSLLLFFVLVFLLSTAVNRTIHHFHLLPPPSKSAGPQPISLRNSIPEIIAFIVFALCAFLMSLIERRPFHRYGLTARRAVPDFLIGLFWGLLALSALVGTLLVTHHLAFDTVLLHGPAVPKYALAWAASFLCVGLLEEFSTRGYIQYTVARGVSGIARALSPTYRHSHVLGFWVSAFLFSVLLFMAGHLGNPGETVPGILAVGIAGAVFAFSLWRTGSLWWAIGFHTSWDWAQSFLYGVPDSGLMVRQHLVSTHPLGRALLSGGATGPEGSLFVIPTLLLVALVIHLTLPRRTYFLTPDQSPLPEPSPTRTIAI